MKAFQLAVVLLLLCISTAEALRCNNCVPRSAGTTCTNTEETCEGGQVCAYVVFTSPRYSYFKRCMKKSDAFALKTVDSCEVLTCTTDLCN